MSSSIDTNVNNYTLSELLTILNIDEPTPENIMNQTNSYIDKFTNENNPTMATFFKNIQSNLLQYSNDLENPTNTEPAEYPPAEKQSRNWWENEALPQYNDPVQQNKVTNRKQKIDIFDTPQVPMIRQQLGVNNTYNLPVAQDSLNPNLKNTITRIVNIDSQYRQSTSPNESSTDYTLDLSEPLLNVLSLSLYSFQIPYTWYSIDVGYNCFWISFIDSSGNTQQTLNVVVPPGNYTSTTFISALNASISATGLTFPVTPASYNNANGLITLNLYGGSVTLAGNTYTINNTTLITFFDPTATLLCASSCNPTLAVNQTLGWIMGFRVPSLLVSSSGNIAIAVAQLFGPRYLILVIDDYNQNHINSGLVGITEYSNTLKLPNYYSPSLPYVCTPANPQGTNMKLNSLTLANDADAGVLLMDKFNGSYSSTATVIPSAPRILTQSQIYSINEIMKNNDKSTNFKLTSPTTSDTFAIIPVKGGMTTGDVYVEFSGSLQDNKRVYFGPVNISRMRVRLLDDKGNNLNLNGADWSLTLLSENLYQY